MREKTSSELWPLCSSAHRVRAVDRRAHVTMHVTHTRDRGRRRRHAAFGVPHCPDKSDTMRHMPDPVRMHPPRDPTHGPNSGGRRCPTYSRLLMPIRPVDFDRALTLPGRVKLHPRLFADAVGVANRVLGALVRGRQRRRLRPSVAVHRVIFFGRLGQVERERLERLQRVRGGGGVRRGGGWRRPVDWRRQRAVDRDEALGPSEWTRHFA